MIRLDELIAKQDVVLSARLTTETIREEFQQTINGSSSSKRHRLLFRDLIPKNNRTPQAIATTTENVERKMARILAVYKKVLNLASWDHEETHNYDRVPALV